MIRTFRHKGLKRLFDNGDRKGIRADLLGKVENILLVLNRAQRANDMDLPGFRLHPLAGDKKGSWGCDGASQLANRVSIREWRCPRR